MHEQNNIIANDAHGLEEFIQRYSLHGISSMRYNDKCRMQTSLSLFERYVEFNFVFISRKHLRTKVTPDFHLTYRKNGENLGS